MNDFDLHTRSQLRKKAETSALFFLQISQSIGMRSGMLASPVGLLKLTSFFPELLVFNGANSVSMVFEDNMFLVDLHLDLYKSISFKLGVITTMTKLYILILL